MTEIVLDTEKKDSSIVVKNYENLVAGFELEGNFRDTTRSYQTQLMEMATHFKVREGKTDGKALKDVKINTPVFAGTLKIDGDLYKEVPLITQVYYDGSVQCEVVTRPLSEKLLDKMETEVFDYVKGRVDLVAGGRSGCHMTFLTDPHKEISEFNPMVVRNLIQFTRAFYPTIIKMFASNGITRKTYYRRIMTQTEVIRCYNASHYSCINVKRNADGKIWGLEIRFPDGTNDFSLLKKQFIFWSAAIRQMAYISRYGLISFSQEDWDKNLNFCNMYNDARISNIRNVNTAQVYDLLKGSLTFYGYDTTEETTQEYQTTQKVMKLYLEGRKLAEILKETGITRYKYNQIIGCGYGG